MIDFWQMVLRFLISLALGALIGLEREKIGKEAGIRTLMIISAGATLFTLAGLSLPYIISGDNVSEILARNSGFIAIIANIVVGIGFLGGGIIIKNEEHIRGMTTASVIWFTAGIGILVGLGLIKFAVFCSLLITILLYLTRKLGIVEKLRQEKQ